MRVTAKRINDAEHWPDLSIVVYGRRVHAPMLERILEIPIDIYDGRKFPWVFPPNPNSIPYPV